MKIFLLLYILLQPNDLQQLPKGTEEEKKMTQKAVVSWAEETFHYFDNPRFENFVAHYTEEYLMMSMRIDMLEKRRSKLDTLNQKEEYETIGAEIEKVKEHVANIEERVTHYEIDFWANISTNDGITVNYKHNVKLDNDFKVVSFEETSSIGKKDKNTQIRYKKLR